MHVSPASRFREDSRRALPRFLFDYIDGAANEELTAAWNIADLAAIKLRQRVLRDVSDISLETALFGQTLQSPVILGPVGLAGMYARRGECQAASASAAHGIPFCLSTVSVCSLDEVKGASGAPPWFQLYMLRDRAFMQDLLAKAAAMGVSVLVFTVDMPIPGCRYRDARSGMTGPYAATRRLLQAVMKPSWAWDVGLRGRPHTLGNLAPVLGARSGMNDFIAWLSANFDPSIAWSDLEWLRESWKGTLIIKGILDCSDAHAAASLGADGIVVSNHGGRQLDGVMSTAQALPPIVDTVGDRLTVLADSGVRSGLDVCRMLALGARGVLLGRAWAYALAADGGRGVTRCLTTIDAEIRTAMALTGVRRIGEIDGSLLA